MTYTKKDHPACPASKPPGCHETEEEANKQLAALYAAEEIEKSDSRRAWDGSASRWPSTEAYCRDCLINLNNGSSDKWVQALCKLPARNPGSNDYDFEAIQAAASGHGITMLQKPDGVDETRWNAAVRKAARIIIQQYHKHNKVAPEAVYKLAGMNMERSLSLDGIVRADPMEDGGYRWVSISCTARLNRVGEIDSRALFDDFVQQIEGGSRPYRTFYHLGERVRYGTVDYAARDGFVLITSGTYDLNGPNADLARAEIRALQENRDEWGESIRYRPTMPPDVEIIGGTVVPVFRTGKLIEVSLLPRSDAAAFGTNPILEVRGMNSKIKDALRKLGVTMERVDEIGDAVDETNRAIIDDPSAIARAADETVAIELEAESSAEAEIELSDDTIAMLVKRSTDEIAPRLAEISTALLSLMEKVEGMVSDAGGLGDKIGELEARIAALELDREEYARSYQADVPRSQRLVVTYRPRQEEKPAGEPSHTELAQEVLSRIRPSGRK
jgi:hypothetical protein